MFGVGLHYVSETIKVLMPPGGALLASGAVRGEKIDWWMIAYADVAIESVEQWLAVRWVHPSIASAVGGILDFGLIGLMILALAALLAGIRGYTNFLVMSDFARRQGRRASCFDLLVGISLPIALTSALTLHDKSSVIAYVWFVIAYIYCHLAYESRRLNDLLDCTVKLKSGISGNGSHA